MFGEKFHWPVFFLYLVVMYLHAEVSVEYKLQEAASWGKHSVMKTAVSKNVNITEYVNKSIFE